MGGTESRLGNWITDAMRAAVGADVALYLAPLQGGGFRSTPLPAGTVDIGDLIACSRPWDMPLETVQLGGRDLLEVLEANLSEPGPARGQPDNVVQISGARYRFDRRHTPGRRIVWSDIDPHRSYRVVLEGQTMEEESLRLGGRFGRLAHHTEEVSFLMALYGHAARSGVIAPRLEGRVVDAASR
jgi:2',3'-cyclic-nucleotide 2'-phosphodiesterase (5'-nucleotidase family)